MCSSASTPTRPARPARRRGSQSATSRGSVGDLVGSRRTAGSTRRRGVARAARPAARRTTIPLATRSRVGRPNRRPRGWRARDRQRVLAHVGRPHLGVGELRRQRERDRARAGTEVGDGVRGDAARTTGRCGPGARRAAPPPRSRSARPPRSRGAGPAPGGRRTGRGRGTASSRARTAAAHRAMRRSSMSSRCCRAERRRDLVFADRPARRRRSPTPVRPSSALRRRAPRCRVAEPALGHRAEIAPGERAQSVPASSPSCSLALVGRERVGDGRRAARRAPGRASGA